MDTTRRTLLLGSTLAFAGLGATLPRAARADSVDDIRAKKKIVIGIQGDNPPWGFVNTSGTQEGFDADIGKMFADYLKVAVEFMPLAVANRIPALTTGRCDVLFATMGMLPDRAKVVQFSKPYVANIISLVAPKATAIKTNADMKTVVIGVPRSSLQDTLVTKNAPEGTTIRRFDDDASTIQALVSGQVQAVGGNMFYVDRLNQSKPGAFENKLEFTASNNGAWLAPGRQADEHRAQRLHRPDPRQRRPGEALPEMDEARRPHLPRQPGRHSLRRLNVSTAEHTEKRGRLPPPCSPSALWPHSSRGRPPLAQHALHAAH